MVRLSAWLTGSVLACLVAGAAPSPPATGSAASPPSAGGGDARTDSHQRAVEFLSRSWEATATDRLPVIVLKSQDRSGQYVQLIHAANGTNIKTTGTWTVEVIASAPVRWRIASTPRQSCMPSPQGCAPISVSAGTDTVFQAVDGGTIREASGPAWHVVASEAQVRADLAAFDRTYGQPAAPSYAGPAGGGSVGGGGLPDATKRMFDEHRAADSCLHGIGYGCGPQPTYH